MSVLQDSLDVLPGEGEQKTITRIRVREECGQCGEPAHFKATYLLEGNARANPASEAYRQDDCSWCSDYEEFFCRVCLTGGWHPSREGYSPCSLFPASEQFAHMFLRWREAR